MKAAPASLFEEFIKEAYGSQYVIPVYQRNYTWQKNKQVKQLLDDIEKILEGKENRHFIGTIVYVIIKTDFIVRERAVVDGQQRLITMFLISHALRKIAYEIGENEIAEIISTSYLENSNAANSYKYRLRPSITDDNDYLLIAEEKFNELDRNSSKVIDNFLYIESRLKNLINKYNILKVINAIRELYIVRIELDDTDNAQQIFESINSTGEKLTAADLIRNYIMMNKENFLQERIYHEYWLKLESIFPESKNMEEFFRLYLASKNYILISKKDLYDSFKDYWKEQMLVSREDDILNDITTYAKHYHRLYLSNEYDPIGISLYDLRKMQSNMPAPFLMEILEIFRKNLISLYQVKEILNLINTYLIRRYIAGQDTSAITRSFPTYLKNTLDIVDKFGYEHIVDICKFILVNETRQKSNFMPDDEYIRQYLKAANAYVLSQTKWLLDKIENHNNPIIVDTSLLSIEHIMPQTPNKYWSEVTQLSLEDYEVEINKLGNLTLASRIDNSRMQNYDFNYKKEILQQTKHLKLNEDILKLDKWDTNDIEQRTSYLTDMILSIFPYSRSIKNYKEHSQQREIFLNRAELIAEGYLHKDGKVTVRIGSNIRYNTKPNLESLKELREDLLEQEIIIFENGLYYFAQDYTFNSPSAAADFIIGGSNNGWDCWKDQYGSRINESLRR